MRILHGPATVLTERFSIMVTGCLRLGRPRIAVMSESGNMHKKLMDTASDERRRNKMEKNEADKKELYRKLQGMQLYVPCTIEKGGNITLELLMNNRGEQMIPAFVSKESDTGSFDSNRFTEFRFPMLRHILIELPQGISGIVIEPFGRNLILDRRALSEYDSYTQGMTVAQHDHQENTQYSKAGKLPDGLKRAVSEFLSQQIGVNAAWVFLAKNERETTTHLTFAVDFVGSKIDLFPKLAAVIRPYMKPGQSFELIEKNMRMTHILTHDTCIYVRKQGPFFVN